MEAESLSIKVRLDASGVTAGVNKVKQQITGMANKVKQSIPQISKESKKAGTALEGVAAASKKATKSLDGIGDEAKKSLGGIPALAKKAKNALGSIGSGTSSIKFGFDTEGMAEGAGAASDSLGELQGTMKNLVHLDFIGILANNFQKIKEFARNAFGPLKESIKGVTSSIGTFVGQFKNVFTAFGKGNSAVKIYQKLIKNLKKDKDLGSLLEDKTVVEVLNKNLDTLKKKLAELNKENFNKLKKSLGEVGEKLKLLSKSAFELIARFSKLALVGVGALVGIAAGMGASIANNTKQYREEQSKLTSAFQAAGASAETASQAYNGLFRFLGDSGKAVEAANHLAKLTTNTQDLAEWTTISQGIYATFGDSLPIEGLTEAANETARVGKVTGTLADALNWAGVNEDLFNARLAQTTSFSEREALIRGTLNGLYNDAAQLYEQNNKQIIAQNEAQARLDATMARIGRQTQVLVTSWINLKNVIMTVLAPAIIYISAVFSVLIDKLAALIQWLGSLIGISFKTDAISGIVSGVGGVSAGISNATRATDGLTDSLDKATSAAQKLKRTTMGFDELNIVSNPNTDSGGAGAAGGAGGVGNIAGIETGKGVFSAIGEQIEDVKSKVEGFFDKWKTQIDIIGGALAALGVAGLLNHLGKAIGLGDTFLNTMSKIKSLASTAITIVLQYTLVNEFMSNYIDGQGFKEYIKGLLVSALGTWVLYSMWGPTGLMIGLGVTAVASIKSVIDNGGITNIESAVVALTGLGTAIGAVSLAVKTFNLGTVCKDIGAFVALLKEGNGLIPTLAAAFPKLSGAIGSVMGPIGAFISSLTVGPILAIAGIIAGITSVLVFLKENWDAVTSTVKRFFEENIVPKLENIKESFSKMGQALSDLIPPGLKKAISDIASAIGDVVRKIAEWFKSIDWIEAIGKVFEVIGGIIFAAVSGPIAGAIDALIGLIDGAVQFISGIVQIVSGVIEAIVALFTGDLPKAGEAAKKIGQGIVDAFTGMYKATIGVVVNFVKGIIDWFVKLWDELVGHSIVPDTVNAIVEWFTSLPSKIFGSIDEFVNGIITKFKDMWSNIQSWFTSNVAPKFTKGYWDNKFDTVRESVSDKLNAAKAAIQKVWGNISGWFKSNVAPKFTSSFWKDKFDSIKNGAKSALNGLISVVESAVNGIIRKINTLSWRIPNWVPHYGGNTFGFNFRTISIPRLATGGIATRSTLVNIGESGREAVLPLDRNTSWMDMLADRIASRNRGPSKIVLMVDGKELGWAAINGINNVTKQTGNLQLMMV